MWPLHFGQQRLTTAPYDCRVNHRARFPCRRSSRWGKRQRHAGGGHEKSELVTNALVHTDRDAVLTADVGPWGLRVEVRDFTAREPRPRPRTGNDTTNGRGLVLVDSLADAWGVRRHGVGKSVWFALGPETETGTDADAA
ncbi:ATP-binding protein [Streptomyces griseoincarnatus]